MPVQYSSIKLEHEAVRERAGLFDVSHMGQIHFSGPGALEALERLVSCRIDSLAVGQIRYGVMCNETGGCVDDVTVYREARDAFFLCVNAANIQKDFEWIRAHVSADAGAEDRSGSTGMLALQGPQSEAALAPLIEENVGADVGALRPFRFDRYVLRGGITATISRTGYTGAGGFELYLPAERTAEAFRLVLAQGEPFGLVPAGLGARDTLRLEAAMALYGHELDDETSPLEAGLERFVKRARGGFIGAEAVERREAAGRTRQLVGFVVEGRGIARADHRIMDGGEAVGRVTSGAPSPTLGKSICLGYVPPRLAAQGRSIEIDVRGKGVEARVVATPFI